jgi:hypothetical protein
MAPRIRHVCPRPVYLFMRAYIYTYTYISINIYR